MDSSQVQDSEGLAVIKVLAVVLERLVAANCSLTEEQKGQVTKFHALRAPVIGIGPYLERIHKYASCSNECFILALIYIDRLIQRNNFLLTELNVHRVVITAILLAAKFFDDAYYNNAYYAKVGGVLVSELNSLEVEFLFRINFSLRVSPEEFQKYNAELSSHASSMGLQAPTKQSQPLLRGYSESENAYQIQETKGSWYFEAEPPAEPFVHAKPVPAPVCAVAQASAQEVFYQQPQVGVNGLIATKETFQNVPHITPSPPPHPPHVQGNISYASDLGGTMYDAYSSIGHQAPPAYYPPPAPQENSANLSNETLFSNWPQVSHISSTSPSTLHYQERSCSQSHQGTVSVPQQYQNHDYGEWQMHTSNYGGQHFVSSPSNQYVKS